ncbi:YjbF family lipoprotein [Gammaproteobacteria bacterium]|nr:YjbF family lipoprotein [Gammaproteobacteria bacterium]
MTKRNVLACVLLLSSCETPLPLYKLVYDTSIEYSSNLNNQVSLETFNSIEYAFISVTLGTGSPKSIMVLSAVNNNIYEWVSESSEKIYTFNGKIIKTEGLSHDIEILNPQDIHSLSQDKTYTLISNFYDPELYSQLQEISIKKKGLKSIKNSIRSRPDLDTRLVVENIHMKKIFWKAQNKYYFNVQSGELERTIQNIHPDYPPLSIDFVRKFN